MIVAKREWKMIKKRMHKLQKYLIKKQKIYIYI